jgi:streptogramin lyase
LIPRTSTPAVIALILLGVCARAAPAASAAQVHPIAELKPQAVLHLGATADWVAITADAVWVGSTGPHAVHRIDPQSNRVVATVPLPGEPCAGLATGFGSLWVPLCTNPSSLARVDLRRNALTAVYKVGPAAAEGGVTTSLDSVWLMGDAKGTLLRIDPQSGTVRQKIALASGSYNPRYHNGRVWVTRAEGAQVSSVDADTGKIIAVTASGPHPRFLAIDAEAVWTLNQGDGSLSRIDPATQRLVTGVALKTPGHGGDISLGGGLVWTTMIKTPLSAVDASTNTLLCQWVGAGGDSLGIGHGAIWLTDYHGGTITRYGLEELTRRCHAAVP